MVNRELLVEFLRVYSFQPATALWRAVEVGVLRKYLPLHGTILDLGCGDGKLTTIAYHNPLTEDINLIGIDIDINETRQAARYSIYKQVHTCSAANIPEPVGSIDHVISNSVLEHIKDIEDTIEGITKLLRRGGTFTFTVPSPGFHLSLRGPILPGISRMKYLDEMDMRLGHYRYFNLDQWRGLLDRYGLHVELFEEYMTYEEMRRWETISRFTAGILYSLYGNRITPINLQKNLGLRRIQNNVKLPYWISKILATCLLANINESDIGHTCLLVQVKKY